MAMRSEGGGEEGQGRGRDGEVFRRFGAIASLAADRARRLVAADIQAARACR